MKDFFKETKMNVINFFKAIVAWFKSLFSNDKDNANKTKEQNNEPSVVLNESEAKWSDDLIAKTSFE